MLDTPKVAVSSVSFGTVAGVQLSRSTQKLFVGVAFQVALPAKAVAAAKSRNTSVGATTNQHEMQRRPRDDRLIEVLRDEVAFVC